MKIRNAIIASGLAMVLSIGFCVPAMAHMNETAFVQKMDGIIENLIMEGNTLVVQLNVESLVDFSLVSPSGTTVWATVTNAEVVTVPIEGLANGVYTLVVVESGKTFFYTVQLLNQPQSGGGLID